MYSQNFHYLTFLDCFFSRRLLDKDHQPIIFPFIFYKPISTFVANVSNVNKHGGVSRETERNIFRETDPCLYRQYRFGGYNLEEKMKQILCSYHNRFFHRIILA